MPWPPAVRKHQRPEEACGANRSREEEGAVAAGGPNAAAGGLFSPFLGIERGLPLAFRHLSAMQIGNVQRTNRVIELRPCCPNVREQRIPLSPLLYPW